MDKEYDEERDNKGYVEINPVGDVVGESYNEEESHDEAYDEALGNEEDNQWINNDNAEQNLGGIYGLFKDVLRDPESTRTSNLDKDELELIRGRAEVELIANTFHHPGVGDFFRNLNLITTDTAMSKKGWFSELFISSKKHATRDSSSSIANLPQNQKKKSRWRVFSDKSEQQPQ